MPQPGSAEVFVGRDAEVAALRRMVADAAAGQGRVVWVEGEPGVGKSTLLRTGLAGASELGCRIFSAAADEVGQRFPLQVMLECLRIGADAGDGGRAQMTDVLRAELRSDMGWASDPVVAASERLVARVDELCATSTVVMAVDDLQWADEASLLLWHRLGRLANQVPLLLVGACRPGSRRPELAKVRRQVLARNGAVLRLRGLSEAESTELLAALLGAVPGPELRRFVDHTAGNPLYLRELTEALVREQAVRVDAGRAEMAAPADAAPSLASVIARRLDFLSPDVRQLLRTAALLGNEFAVTDLATILERPPADLVTHVQDAVAAEVLVDAGERLAFRHPLLRRELYRSIPVPARVAAHRHAAQQLAEAGAPVERVAEQLLEAPATAGEWLVEWLAQAAPTLTYRAPQIVAELLTRVVEDLPSGDPNREALAADLVSVLFRTERDAEAERWTREVLKTTIDPERAARMRWCLGYILFRTGRLDEARAETRAALADPTLPGPWPGRLQSLKATILGCGFGDVAATEAAALRTLELGEQAADLFTVGQAMSSFFFVHAARRDYRAALSVLDRGLALLGGAQDHGDLRPKLLDERIFTLHNLDRLEEAETTLRTARRLAEEGGEAPATRLHVSAAVHYFWLGRWEDALAEITAAADNLAELTSFGLRARWQILLMHGVAAFIHGHREDHKAATAQLRLGHGQPMTSAADLDNCDFLVAAAALAAENEGRPAAALAMFAPYLDPTHGQTLLKHQWLPGVVRLALELGDVDVARTATRTCEAEAAVGASPRASAAVDRCRGLLDGDPELLLATAEHYRAVGRVFELAQTVEDAAVVHARAGHAAAARASLAEATQLYSELGAAWDLRRAEEKMRGYGIRLGTRAARRRPTSGWEALSATELTVAYLVAEARSNPEIAGMLFLSRRTVQTHVSHILTKLGARSRVEIAKEALRHPRPVTPE
ncbi:MAG: hypothetical protein AUI14_07300 [Actinobacteria bacterium 13_2_20CM_2_71_6]|nr:MAG: hypothetical protein AUI14_07300 [Actinobacteria bacterium 13_2_20CM_2_71_6]